MCIEGEVRLHRTQTSEALTSLSENTILLFKKSDNIPTLHEDIHRCSISKHLEISKQDPMTNTQCRLHLMSTSKNKILFTSTNGRLDLEN